MVLSASVDVRPGGVHGHCWFAREAIPAGAMVWEKGATDYNDVDLPKAEIMSWPADKRETFMALAYQVRPGVYRGTDPSKAGAIPQSEQNEYYVNHCCDGNCWYEGDDRLVAMRDIAAGEELYYDYALTEADEDWILAPKCLCGTAACRGLVTGNDWRRPELQAKYGDHFTEYILQLIKDDKAKQQQQQQQQ